MKEHQILFNGPMVRALLDGQKTQTRRIVNPKPDAEAALGFLIPRPNAPGSCAHFHDVDDRGVHSKELTVHCPYGQPGDRLWVREAFAYSVIDPEGLSPEDDPENYDIIYRATDQPAGGWSDGAGNRIKAPWKPSTHMPRWASRIALEIVSVRVERLQDISEADALAEGITCENVIVSTYYANGHHEVREDRYFFGGCQDEGFDSAVEAYAALWEYINGAGSWEANPWLWVVEFRRLP